MKSLNKFTTWDLIHKSSVYSTVALSLRKACARNQSEVKGHSAHVLHTCWASASEDCESLLAFFFYLKCVGLFNKTFTCVLHMIHVKKNQWRYRCKASALLKLYDIFLICCLSFMNDIRFVLDDDKRGNSLQDIEP